jgi:hypothetical protein
MFLLNKPRVKKCFILASGLLWLERLWSTQLRGARPHLHQAKMSYPITFGVDLVDVVSLGARLVSIAEAELESTL